MRRKRALSLILILAVMGSIAVLAKGQTIVDKTINITSSERPYAPKSTMAGLYMASAIRFFAYQRYNGSVSLLTSTIADFRRGPYTEASSKMQDDLAEFSRDIEESQAPTALSFYLIINNDPNFAGSYGGNYVYLPVLNGRVQPAFVLVLYFDSIVKRRGTALTLEKIALYDRNSSGDIVGTEIYRNTLDGPGITPAYLGENTLFEAPQGDHIYYGRIRGNMIVFEVTLPALDLRSCSFKLPNGETIPRTYADAFYSLFYRELYFALRIELPDGNRTWDMTLLPLYYGTSLSLSSYRIYPVNEFTDDPSKARDASRKVSFEPLINKASEDSLEPYFTPTNGRLEKDVFHALVSPAGLRGTALLTDRGYIRINASRPTDIIVLAGVSRMQTFVFRGVTDLELTLDDIALNVTTSGVVDAILDNSYTVIRGIIFANFDPPLDVVIEAENPVNFALHSLSTTERVAGEGAWAIITGNATIVSFKPATGRAGLLSFSPSTFENNILSAITGSINVTSVFEGYSILPLAGIYRELTGLRITFSIYAVRDANAHAPAGPIVVSPRKVFITSSNGTAEFVLSNDPESEAREDIETGTLNIPVRYVLYINGEPYLERKRVFSFVLSAYTDDSGIARINVLQTVSIEIPRLTFAQIVYRASSEGYPEGIGLVYNTTAPVYHLSIATPSGSKDLGVGVFNVILYALNDSIRLLVSGVLTNGTAVSRSYSMKKDRIALRGSGVAYVKPSNPPSTIVKSMAAQISLREFLKRAARQAISSLLVFAPLMLIVILISPLMFIAFFPLRFIYAAVKGDPEKEIEKVHQQFDRLISYGKLLVRIFGVGMMIVQVLSAVASALGALVHTLSSVGHKVKEGAKSLISKAKSLFS